MPHLRRHSFTGTTDHDFTGLSSGQLLIYNGTGIVSSGVPISKYSTTLTSPTANTTNTITHNLGTTDVIVALWLVTTGDLTNAKITNRQTNSVDVIFSSAPGENVRVVITG